MADSERRRWRQHQVPHGGDFVYLVPMRELEVRGSSLDAHHRDGWLDERELEVRESPGAISSSSGLRLS